MVPRVCVRWTATSRYRSRVARPRADPELLRKIAVAVFELVAARGVDGASMRAVAGATGLSTGTLNYHFTNKRGLVHFALHYAYATPPDWREHAGHASKGLARLLRRYVLARDDVRAWWRFFCAVTAHAARDCLPRSSRRPTDVSSS